MQDEQHMPPMDDLEVPADVAEVFGEDLSHEQTGMPLLKPGNYLVRWADSKIEPNKKQTGNNLNLIFETVEPAETLDGKELKPGFKLFHTVSLVPTDKYRPQQNLAALKQCFTGIKAGSFGNPQEYLGFEGYVRVDVEKGDETYDPRSVIK